MELKNQNQGKQQYGGKTRKKMVSLGQLLRQHQKIFLVPRKSLPKKSKLPYPNLKNLLGKAGILNSPQARCQCLASCPNPPLEGEAFCKAHMKRCPRKAPLSGAEPDYEPQRWNEKKEVRTTHNCFSYAMNILDIRQIKSCLEDPECDVPFHQPGSISGYPKFNDTDPKTCPNMIARLMGDNPVIHPSSFELRCPKDTSKIALVVDEDQDYHFLRQDSNGFFSQKSGGLPVTNLDALGHRIFDVQLANHNWHPERTNNLNYDRFCGYFCVPRKQPLWVKVGGRRQTRRQPRRQPRH